MTRALPTDPLARLRAEKALQPIDAHFADWIERQDRAAPGASDARARAVGLAAALVSAARAAGHGAVSLRDPGVEGFDAVELPDVDAWCALLHESPLVSTGDGAPTPLVLRGERLALWRYRSAERRLARALLRLVADEHPLPSGLAALTELFPEPFAADEPDRQALAACAALGRRLAVVVGGPGTGKTTTVARILALLALDLPDARVVLAAPTGKAAARLSESLRSEQARLPEGFRAAQPLEGRTLHRLLEYHPGSDRFLRDRSRPLPADVVVVDEASMIDLPLFAALLDACARTARVVLLGDPDQLPSVGVGRVLADLAAVADPDRGAGPRLAALFETATGIALPPRQGRATPWADAVVRLHRSYRFEKQPGIGALAVAVRDGRGGQSFDVLERAAHPDVTRLPAIAHAADGLAPIREHLQHTLAAEDAATFLERFATWQVLCAVREGPLGVRAVNRAIERHVLEAGDPRHAHFEPVLVTANDERLRLWNGDVGVVVRAPGRPPRAFFPDESPDGPSLRELSPVRLPPHEPAWAITVHKSQGSEYDHVLIVLPDRDSPVLTRELVYTAITRARRSVAVVASPSVWRRAVERPLQRGSGLPELLDAD